MKLAALVLALVTGGAQAGNYAACILDKMPGTANLPAALAVHRLCTAEFPGQYAAVPKGDGRGLFGFDSSEACLVKKSRDTLQPNASYMIAAACRCLYDKPEYAGQTCADPPFSPVQP